MASSNNQLKVINIVCPNIFIECKNYKEDGIDEFIEEKFKKLV